MKRPVVEKPDVMPTKKSKKKRKLNLSGLNQDGDGVRVWPQRLLVFDMNGVLISRSLKPLPNVSANFRDPKGKYVYDRPHMRELLFWALKSRGFKIALWTSASPPVAAALSKHIFGFPKFQIDNDCDFVWSGEKCDGRNLCLTKPLSRIWSEKTEWGPHNTIMIDNSAFKVSKHADNLIHMETFDPGNATAGEDAMGKKIWDYLDKLQRTHGDVREFMKECPYTEFGKLEEQRILNNKSTCLIS